MKNSIDLSRERNQSPLIAFDLLPDDLVLCAVFSSRIMTINPKSAMIEEVFKFDGQCVGAAWSPDFQLLVVATSSSLYYLSADFELVSEGTIDCSTPGHEELMTIGWGSVQTQFQGSAGRKHLSELDPEDVRTPLFPYDTRSVVLRWRADGQYLAVSFPYEENGINSRHLSVWSKDGQLLSRCITLAGAEEAVTFRPVGNLIAASRVLSGKRDIVFYERNGQKRHSFYLGLQKRDMVHCLAWNVDGSILMVHLISSDKSHYVHFWCVSNYDWTLKKQFVWNDGLADVKWDAENSHRFHFLTRTGRYGRIDVDFCYNFSDMMVVVVNDNKIRVTDFHMASIPPPLCHYQLNFTSAICCVAQSKKHIAFLLSNRTVSLCEYFFMPLL
ncbi:hypothetical protein AB6A40_004277 [Gnathostoma spinigerum]|uniref:Elongator complex protein 1 n=1 Tax=Gnathostoma spinigerum TaxID=75299 RepID=A0ABD6EC64_9BILA